LKPKLEDVADTVQFGNADLPARRTDKLKAANAGGGKVVADCDVLSIPLDVSGLELPIDQRLFKGGFTLLELSNEPSAAILCARKEISRGIVPTPSSRGVGKNEEFRLLPSVASGLEEYEVMGRYRGQVSGCWIDRAAKGRTEGVGENRRRAGTSVRIFVYRIIIGHEDITAGIRAEPVRVTAIEQAADKLALWVAVGVDRAVIAGRCIEQVGGAGFRRGP